jgi:hypothetical protein
MPSHSLALLLLLCTNCYALEIDSVGFRLSTLTYATLTTLLTILRDRCAFDCSFWFYSVFIYHFVLGHDFIIINKSLLIVVCLHFPRLSSVFELITRKKNCRSRGASSGENIFNKQPDPNFLLALCWHFRLPLTVSELFEFSSLR